MDLANALALISIVLTVVFGVLGLGFWQKRRLRNNTKLLFYKRNALGIFSSIAKQFDSIQIRLNEKEVSKNLYYVQITVVNGSGKDIRKEEIETPISLALSNNSKWVETKIKQVSDGFKCDIETVSDSKIQFNHGLFKSGEFFTFDGILELDDKSKYVWDSIKISHRFYNYPASVFEEFPGNLIEKNFVRSRVLRIIYSLIGVTALTIGMYLFSEDPVQVYYDYGNSKQYEFIFENLESPNFVVLSNGYKYETVEVSLADFLKLDRKIKSRELSFFQFYYLDWEATLAVILIVIFLIWILLLTLGEISKFHFLEKVISNISNSDNQS